MNKRLILIVLTLGLSFFYLTLNARTAQRLMNRFDSSVSAAPTFFVEPEKGLLAQILPTQSQTAPQTQTQSQSQTRTQTQTQTQTLYIGFPMQISWKFSTAGPIIAQPQVDQTSVYCVSKPGVFYRLNQSDNKQLWKKNIGDVVEEGFILNGQTLFYGTQKGRLGAFHTDKGRELWRQDIGEESFLTQPGYDEKNIYWVGQHGTILALAKSDGKMLWKFKAQGSCATSPFVAGKALYFGCDDHVLYALDTSAGFLKWKFYAGKEIKGSPIATGDHVFFGADDEYFYCLQQDNGKVVWKHRTGGAIRGVPMFYMDQNDQQIKDVLFASFDNFLYDMKIKNGTRKWLSATSARVYNRMHFDRALIFVAAFGSSITGYDPHTGERVGDFNAQNRIRSSPITKADRLFIGLNNGNLLCLTRTPPPPPQTDEVEGLVPPAAPQSTSTQTAEEETVPETQTQTQTQTQSQPGSQ